MDQQQEFKNDNEISDFDGTKLKIYNHLDVPFGPLSNNYLHFMNINNNTYGTVTNFILSNMLITPLFRTIISEASIKGDYKNTDIDQKIKQRIINYEAQQGRVLSSLERKRYIEVIISEVVLQKMPIYQLYNHYLTIEDFNIKRLAVEKAYNAKLQNNPDLIDKLLSTGNSPILYVSGNIILGSGTDNNGYNLIGTILMQCRHNFRILKIKQQELDLYLEKEEQIFSMYKAQFLLEKELLKENDVFEYIGKNPDEIINLYFSRNPDMSLKQLGLDTDNLKILTLQQYRRGQYPIFDMELKQPGYLSLTILKNYIEQKRKIIILQTYTQYLLSSKFPNMSQERINEASKQLSLSAPSYKSYISLLNHISNLYESGKLFVEHSDDKPSLVDNIKHQLDELYHPFITKIKEFEHIPSISNVEPSQEQTSSSLDEDPIKKLLSSDKKSEKSSLITLITRYSGKSEKHYKKKSLDELKQILEKVSKKPKESTGHWLIYVRHPKGNIKENIGEQTGKRPSNEDLENIASDYNKHNTKQITRYMMSYKWVPKNITEKQDITQVDDETLQEQRFIKPSGRVIEIYPLLEQKSQFPEFSPLFEELFTVDGLTYNSVSIYITAMLLTQTGIYNNENVGLMRGRSITNSRKLLLIDPNIENKFVDINTATEIYNKENKETHIKLESNLAEIALHKKFEDRNLQDLLLLTNNSILLWNDPNDNVLGSGSSKLPGANVVGNIMMNIRTGVKDSRKKEDFPVIGPDDVKYFMTNDPFMVSWVNMRLTDMCRTVYKVKNYLWNNAKQDEEINERFVNIVLDKIYQPCSIITSLSKKVSSSPPDYFINTLTKCKGIKLKLSKNFDDELDKLYDDMSAYTYLTTPNKKVDKTQSNYENFIKEQKDEYKNFMKQNPSIEEQEEFKKLQDKQMDMFIKEFDNTSEVALTNNFAKKQLKAWKKYKKQIMKPELPMDVIEEKMKKLEEKQAKERLKYKISSSVDNLENREFLQKQSKDRKDLWRTLTQPANSKEQIASLLYQFFIKQDDERRKHYGVDIKKLTPEEMKTLDSRNSIIIDDIKKRIKNLENNRSQQVDHYFHNIRDVAKAYWNHLVIMIHFLIQHIKNSNTQDIRKVIVNIELLNSQPTFCKGRFLDEQDNCIASALFNLLLGIELFKKEYSDKIPSGRHDIDLAGTILLSKDTEKLVHNEKQEEEVTVGDDIEFTDDFGLEESYEENDDYGDIDESSPYSNYRDEQNDDSGHFGMRVMPNNNLERAKILLRQIYTKIDDEDDLANYFLTMIETIKNHHMSKKVKTNRINFFATIR
jgi:predicted NAD-dependent protein-ADP-ribosyltransferase YbiA (DUF1768 family)